MDSYNNEKYRVCLDEYLDEDGEFWHAIELAPTDGKEDKVLCWHVRSCKSKFTEEDLDDN